MKTTPTKTQAGGRRLGSRPSVPFNSSMYAGDLMRSNSAAAYSRRRHSSATSAGDSGACPAKIASR